MTRRTTLLCAVLSLWATQAHAQQETRDVQDARIARVEHGLSLPVVLKGAAGQKLDLHERMAFHQVPAVSIALIDRGTLQWARAYGVTDSVDGSLAATPDTLFQAASISKTLSAIGAMVLVQQGKVALDAPANAQLKAWKIPDNDLSAQVPVTPRMLLNHSAGLTVHGYGGYPQGQPLPSLLQELDGTVPANEPAVRVDVKPGSVWRYSGGGFSVLQLMMTESAGQPFDNYIQKTVLQPLGMKHSTFAVGLSAAQRAATAAGHGADGSRVPGRWHAYPESAAAGLWSTPSDLANVVLEVQHAANGMSGKVLSHDSATAMLTRGLGEYGLGLFVENLGDRTSFSHSGGATGFRSQLYGYTKTGQGVVIMTNSDNGAALIDEILASISAEYDWPEFKVIEKTAVARDAVRSAELAGEYQLFDTPATLRAEGERLYLQCDLFGARPLELFAQSPDAFFMTAQDMEMKVQRGGDGKVTGFALVRGGTTYPATRL